MIKENATSIKGALKFQNMCQYKIQRTGYKVEYNISSK